MSAEGSRAPRRILLVVFVTVFLDLLGFGILIPIQPFYAEYHGASPALVTLLGGSYSFMQFLFAPFWGRLSDRIGRRPVMLVSIAIGATGYALFGAAGSLGGLFAARMLSGFGTANIATAQAIIADVTGPEDRARGMGLLGAAFGLGFLLGPAIGGVAGQWGPAWPAWVAGGLGAINLVLAAFILPETNPPGRRVAPNVRTSRMDAFRMAWERPVVRNLVLISFLLTTGFALMEQVLGLLLERRFILVGPEAPAHGSAEAMRQSAALVATFLVVVGVTSTIVQGGLIGRLTRRFGEWRLLLVGLGALAASLAALPHAAGVGAFVWMLPVAFVLSLGSGLSSPMVPALVSRYADASHQGALLGLSQSLSALGRAVGPAVAGLLFEVRDSLPFHAAGVMMLLTGMLAWWTLGSVQAKDARPPRVPAS